MKQKYQLQKGVTKYKNAATPLSTSGMNTTRQHFQMRHLTLFYLEVAQSSRELLDALKLTKLLVSLELERPGFDLGSSCSLMY